jgi:hypothetical protein
VDSTNLVRLNQASAELVPPLRQAAALVEWCVERHPPPLPSYYPRNLGILYQVRFCRVRFPALILPAIEDTGGYRGAEGKHTRIVSPRFYCYY